MVIPESIYGPFQGYARAFYVGLMPPDLNRKSSITKCDILACHVPVLLLIRTPHHALFPLSCSTPLRPNRHIDQPACTCDHLELQMAEHGANSFGPPWFSYLLVLHAIHYVPCHALRHSIPTAILDTNQPARTYDHSVAGTKMKALHRNPVLSPTMYM